MVRATLGMGRWCGSIYLDSRRNYEEKKVSCWNKKKVILLIQGDLFLCQFKKKPVDKSQSLTLNSVIFPISIRWNELSYFFKTIAF